MSNWSEKTRASLLQRVKDPRDESSWREFVGIYEPLLYRYARLRGLTHENAQEVVQDSLTQLVQTMPGFEYSSGKGKFKGWLRRLANNKINDMFKRRRPVNAESDDFRRPQACEASADEIWEEQWQRKHLRFCLKEVLAEASPGTRQAFELYVVMEHPVEKVMEVLNISADQVYAAKSRITQRLRKRYQELSGESR
jgi:RNA polymerase sigma-70 factor (ECF subfamily)